VSPPAAASTVRPAAPLAPRRRPAAAPRPRRVSGPARRPQARPAPAQDGLVVGVLGALESVSTHRYLDRLIRGRLWIGIVAFALIGIVTLQLGLLKLNSGIGRSLEREAMLQRENAALSIENSELAAGNRVESQAASLGMKLVPISNLHFLSSHAHVDVAKAAAALHEAPHPAPVEASPEAGSGEGATEARSSSGQGESGEAQTSGESGGAASSESSEPSESSPTPGGEATTSAGEAPPAEAGGGTAAPGG
jgi:cell division protein FtsL